MKSERPKSAKPCIPARARGVKRKFRRKKKPGQPDDSRKLCDRLREDICQNIRRGLSKEDASRLCGITRETLRQWRGRGEEELSGPYRRFAEDVELAELQAKDSMLQKLLRDKDPKWTWNILKNRYPHEFKERITTELSGLDRGLIRNPNPFTVEVNCVAPEGGWEAFWKSPEERGLIACQGQGGQPPQNGV